MKQTKKQVIAKISSFKYEELENFRKFIQTGDAH